MKLVERRLSCEGLGNLEWISVGLRNALHADATRMLEGLLNDAQLKVSGDEKRPGEKRMGAQSKDGAVWIWEVARINFPGAVEILDYYNAREYFTEIVEILFGEAGARKLQQWKDLFFEDKIEEVIRQARIISAAMTGDAKLVNAKINYFENNKHRMKYGTYRQKGYFYGSGVIEAGCKSVIGKRAKQSGMFWSSPGVENVLAIRTALHSNRFDSYWDQKNAA